MTPRGERRHYLTKACSTALGCQQSKKKEILFGSPDNDQSIY
jgi:hypothetical protein